MATCPHVAEPGSAEEDEDCTCTDQPGPVGLAVRFTAVLKAHIMVDGRSSVGCRCGFSAAKYHEPANGQPEDFTPLPAYRHYREHVAVALEEVVER